MSIKLGNRTLQQPNYLGYVAASLMGLAAMCGGCAKNGDGNDTILGRFANSLNKAQAYPGDYGPNNYPQNIRGGYVGVTGGTIQVGGDGRNRGGVGVTGVDEPVPALQRNSGRTFTPRPVIIDTGRRGND